VHRAVAAELVPPKLQQYLVDHILKGGDAAPDPRVLTTALLSVVLALATTRVTSKAARAHSSSAN